MNDNKNKFYLTANIKLEKETALLKEKATQAIKLPSGAEKQPDLLYFSAIFVSSGENLNHAYFMGSELVAAEGTIINKALDVEHEEQNIIGAIYDRAFLDKDGNRIEISELASHDVAGLDSKELHIAIAGVVYKNRFPNVAKEVAENKWCVSMECYFQDFDVKVGNVVISRKEAEALGIASIESVIGKLAKVVKNGKEIAADVLTRVLRGICFSGCGIVKNPANPGSIILETAKVKNEDKDDDSVVVFDYDKLNISENNNVTSDTIEGISKDQGRDGRFDDTVGICVSYKRSVSDKQGNIIQNDWCSRYDKSCTSFSRDTTDPDCLYVKDVQQVAKARIDVLLKEKAAKDKRVELLNEVQAALREAVKTQSR